MGYVVDNGIIMAAGISSRFVPLSYERPKALIEARGEILIERQIRQLLEAGVPKVIVVTGYKQEQFAYLKGKFGVILAENPDYQKRNNHASIYAVREYLHNSYVCSADNYFVQNPFENEVDDSYYAAVYASGPTKEWCLETDASGYINRVQIGGQDAWYMLGHTFWNQEFSASFLKILEEEYELPETTGLLWESIYSRHLDILKMRMRTYPAEDIWEFDTLDELRGFDPSYRDDTRSQILKEIAKRLDGREGEILQAGAVLDSEKAVSGFSFIFRGKRYVYDYQTKSLEREGKDEYRDNIGAG